MLQSQYLDMVNQYLHSHPWECQCSLQIHIKLNRHNHKWDMDTMTQMQTKVNETSFMFELK